MLTIINDPTGATGWRSHDWDCTLTIQQNIERHLDFGEGCSVRLNGLPIDPASDPVMEFRPRTTDELMIAKRPEGFDPFTWAIIAVVATTAVVYSMMPKVQATSAAAAKDSPNNRLTAQTNSARAYQGIPDVYGTRRVWPDLIQPSVIEYRDHVKYVTELMCISRGEGSVSDVRYSDTEIVSGITGSSYEVFSPQAGAGFAEDRQTIVPNVVESFAVADVDGQEIAPGLDFVPMDYPSATVFYSIGQVKVQLPNRTNIEQLHKIIAAYPGDLVSLSITRSSGVQTFSVPIGSIADFGSGARIIFAANPFGTNPLSQVTAVSIGYSAKVPSELLGPYPLPTEADQIRFNVVFPRGLKGTASVRIDLWRVDAGGAEVAGSYQKIEKSYSGDTFESRYFTETVTPSAGPGRYMASFRRLNAENGEGTDTAKLEALYALKTYASKSFPGVTLIRVETKATENATSFRERKINVRWSRRVKSLLSGGGFVPSSNFGYAIAHLWQISGRDIGQIDTAALLAINNKFGTESPLLSFNGSLDDADMSLGERIRLIADHARCVVWRDGNKWTFTRDEARSFPELQIDYLNMAPDEPTLSYSAHLPSTHDGVELEYVDPSTQASKVYVRLNVSSGSIQAGSSANPLRIKLPGCTNATQAANRAHLEANRLIYQRQSLKLSLLGDGMDLGPGSLVRWIDPDDFYADDKLQAGEVLSVSGSIVKTSETLRWDGQTQGRILFTGANGRYLGAPVLCTFTEGGVQLASIPADLFTSGGDRQVGSRYVFAVGLTAAELESASLWTVTGAQPNSNGSVSVACVNYDSRIYQND